MCCCMCVCVVACVCVVLVCMCCLMCVCCVGVHMGVACVFEGFGVSVVVYLVYIHVSLFIHVCVFV